MTPRRKRMLAVSGLIAGLGLAAALGFTAFSKNLMYFYTPSDLGKNPPAAGAKLRLGGLVETGSVVRSRDSLRIEFTLADCTSNVKLRYEGILPDLFREGQGIVAIGSMDPSGTFIADEVLAKHDENYMPPDLAESLQGADGKHSCAPFKPVSLISPPLEGGAGGGVRAQSARGNYSYSQLTPPPSPLPQVEGEKKT